LLSGVSDTVKSFDVTAVVIGLPVRMDGIEGVAAEDARRLARNFQLSLGIPVYLQDERLTSQEAAEELRVSGYQGKQLIARLDSAAAAIILSDYLAQSCSMHPASDQLP
jgi:putative Holliday junction resolvase